MFFRPVVRSGGALLLALVICPVFRLHAQYRPTKCDTTTRAPERLTAERNMARRYAPVLRFAPNARYFPTLPFFTALDGFDNDRDGLVDLADSNEVTLRPPNEVHPSWLLLNQAYTSWLPKDTSQVAEEMKPSDQITFGINHSSVLYRVCQLEASEVRGLFRFLKSDEQAWHHIQVIDSITSVIPEHTQFDVIQYYFYYVRDLGLEGHPEDIEMVFMFIPVDPVLARQFRIVVGTGHTSRTPNNVLVLFAPQMGVDSLSDTLSVLVEGGGHSSAPDLPPYGQFTPGMDVNWHIYDVWGTRDVQAVGGTGFAGRYRPEMTFPRDGRNTVVLFPSRYKVSDRQTSQQKSPTDQDTSIARGYRLMPIVPFMRLSQLLEPHDLDTARIHGLINSIVASGDSERVPGSIEAQWRFKGFEGMNDQQRSVATRWMRYWNQNMILTPAEPNELQPAKQSKKKHQIWEHDGYLHDPTNIFKGHLFRPTMADVSGFHDVLRLFTWGITGYPEDAYEPYIGVVFPAIPFPVRLPGYSEIQFGAFRRNYWSDSRTSFSITWVWEDHRNHLLSWYRKLSFTPHRAEVLGEESADVGLTVGISVLPYIQPNSGPSDPINALRLRVGLRLDLEHPDDALRRVGWEIGLQFRQ
jgi:hypothetical protein